MDSVKTSCKLSLFNENDVAASGLDLASTSNIPYMPFDPASTEVVLDLGRALYKLMFQLLLLIESNHKISSNVVNHFRQNENVIIIFVSKQQTIIELIISIFPLSDARHI